METVAKKQLMDLIEKQTENQARHPWEVARFKILNKIFRRNASFSRADTFTVLDIGCGDTYIANAFLNIYPNVKYYAVDTAFTSNMITEYNSKFKNIGKEIYLYNNLSDINNNVSADVVFLFDVIEHIDNEIAFLKQLKNNALIKESADLYITVPAFNSLFSSHDIFLKHFRRYNAGELKRVISNSELKCVEQGYFFFSLLIPRYLNVLKEKNNSSLKHTKGIGVWKSKGIIDKIIVACFMLDYCIMVFFKLFGIKLPGLSNYIICKQSV